MGFQSSLCPFTTVKYIHGSDVGRCSVMGYLVLLTCVSKHATFYTHRLAAGFTKTLYVNTCHLTRNQVSREQKKYSFKYISDSCVLYKTRYLSDYHLFYLLITKSNGTIAITLRRGKSC